MNRIGFIGAGKMAAALIGAILRAKLVPKEAIICSDINQERLREIHKNYGVQTVTSNLQVLKEANIVFLAFKPQNFPAAVENLKTVIREDQIVVSILAGVRTKALSTYLPARVVRVMPNTACLVGEMAAAVATSENVSRQDLQQVIQLLACAGTVVEVTEEQLDAVTGLSGSGPAFVAYLIESFIVAGVAAGLTEKVSRRLTLKTFAGTAKLLEAWQMEPQELIDMVSSPNGTTVAGREILENSDVATICQKTILRARQRSIELGN